MFECSACTLRAIRCIAAESLPYGGRQTRPLLTPHLTRRRASTEAATSTTNTAGEPYLNAAQVRHQKVVAKSFIRKHEAADDDPFIKLDIRPFVAKETDETIEVANRQSSAAKASQDRALRKELEWLPDPLKFAEHVHYTLRSEKVDKALELVRLASKTMNCLVAWNYIIDWHMKAGKVGEAVKVYNEMKKRAQFPDARTYTLMLRGLVGIQDKDTKMTVREEHVSKAVSLYHSMSAPTSRVTPTIIHTNAALKVCAFGQDMDAFWGIASKIPEHGAGAADHVTYSIILNAIRHEAVRDVEDDAAAAAVSEKRQKAVQEGRRVWQEVIQKWRAGQVKIDEQLVCAMARVLLISERIGDWDDVLSLVQQTLNIDRLIAPYGSPERNTAHVPQTLGEQDTSTALSAVEQEDHDGFVNAPAAKVFKPVNPLPHDSSKPGRPSSLAYVQPGNDVLSVLTEACTQMRAPKTGTAYWDLFTGPGYGLKPDALNFQAFLRSLAKSRASARAARLLTHDLKDAGVKSYNMTFRLALEVCARDWKNPNVIDHATKIIDVMEEQQSDVDISTLKKYISLALNTDNGPKIVSVLDRLDRIVHALKSRVTYGTDSKVMDREKHLHDRKQTLSFFQVMVGAMDTLMNRGLVGREEFEHWHGRRTQLTHFITRSLKGIGRTEREMGIAIARKGEDSGKEGTGFVRSAVVKNVADLSNYGLRPKVDPRRTGRVLDDGRALTAFKNRGRKAAEGAAGNVGGRRGRSREGKRHATEWDGKTEQRNEVFVDSPADFGM